MMGRIPWAAATLAFVALSGCTEDAYIGAERPSISGADSGVARTRDAAVLPGADATTCLPVECGGRVYECGNCLDDDRDGEVDMDDPECLGPCQDSEATFANERPGQGHGNCSLDCYFDQDSGFGNDDCVWSHECDPKSVAPDFPPEGMACAYDPGAKLARGATCADAQTDECRSVCGLLTPNGCDCFGCCDIPAVGTVFIGSVDAAGNPSCDLEHAADPTRCKPCTQVESCKNPCDDCELCVGKRELPPSCGNSTSSCAVPECPAGAAPCGQDCLPACATGLSCITGCCIQPPR
ncbi:MAG TPA: hypothetical protein VHU80_20030 [Polyangiaceae bacterium]|jgi:hypothetical protein|nr:hypothetical protein [Polyangiaceae bacterium]